MQFFLSKKLLVSGNILAMCGKSLLAYREHEGKLSPLSGCSVKETCIPANHPNGAESSDLIQALDSFLGGYDEPLIFPLLQGSVCQSSFIVHTVGIHSCYG